MALPPRAVDLEAARRRGGLQVGDVDHRHAPPELQHHQGVVRVLGDGRGGVVAQEGGDRRRALAEEPHHLVDHVRRQLEGDPTGVVRPARGCPPGSRWTCARGRRRGRPAGPAAATPRSAGRRRCSAACSPSGGAAGAARAVATISWKIAQSPAGLSYQMCLPGGDGLAGRLDALALGALDADGDDLRIVQKGPDRPARAGRRRPGCPGPWPAPRGPARRPRPAPPGGARPSPGPSRRRGCAAPARGSLAGRATVRKERQMQRSACSPPPAPRPGSPHPVPPPPAPALCCGRAPWGRRPCWWPGAAAPGGAVGAGRRPAPGAGGPGPGRHRRAAGLRAGPGAPW